MNSDSLQLHSAVYVRNLSRGTCQENSSNGRYELSENMSKNEAQRVDCKKYLEGHLRRLHLPKILYVKMHMKEANFNQ